MCVNLFLSMHINKCHCGPNGVLIIEVPLCRTVYCGPNGVLIMQVSLYRTGYCGPDGVLITEVPLYMTVYCIQYINAYIQPQESQHL